MIKIDRILCRRVGKLPGSHVDRVLRQAPCPVLVAGERFKSYGAEQTN